MANASTPRFEVIRIVGQYDCYDRIVAWTRRRIAVTQTAAWAFALRDREDIDHDINAEVREIATGKVVHRQFAPIDWSSADVIPF